MRVSELITIKEIQSWSAGDSITIKAGTGAGKSYFIKNNLYALAKKENAKILMLLHRTNCVNQFLFELEKDNKLDVIDIKTYQKLEFKELNKLHNDFSRYKYIVCDEFHYFMSDASYSKTTDISLNIILAQKDAVKIFMSATGNYMKSYINNVKNLPTIDYQLPINYSFIKELSFYSKDETLEKFTKEAIEKNQKTILFIQSAEKAYNLYTKYKKHSVFNCSKDNKKYYKYVDKDKIDDILAQQKFADTLLITTTCMDAGINIVDTDLKHIVCDVDDTGTLIQCIGRKRIQNKDDKICLYIKSVNNRSLGGKKTQLQKKLRMAEFLQTHTVREFIETYKKQYINNIIYDDTVGDEDKGTKKINEMMFFKVKNDLYEVQKMLSYGDYGYCKFIKELFNINRYRIVEERKKIDDIETYIKSVIGKKLKKPEQKELINIINLRDSRNRQQKSIGQLNEYFKANNLGYLIVPKMSSEIIKGKKKNFRIWEIITVYLQN